MPRVRGRSNASSLGLSILTSAERDPDDPFKDLMQPPPNETPGEREERIRAEREAKRVNDEIDDELRREKAALKKKSPVRVLLLGQSESGKSTTLKNFQIHYAPQSWHEERACWRAVVQLNLIRSVSLVLDMLSTAPSPVSAVTSTGFPMTPPLSSRYTPLLVRLMVAEGLLRHRLSPTDTDEPGDYRTFSAISPDGAEATLHAGMLSPLTERRKEFFVRSTGAAGSWKARFLRRVSNASNNLPSTSGHLRGSLDGWRTDGKDEATDIIVECREEMRRLWQDKEVRAVLAQQPRGQKVEDTPGFFLNEVDRIAVRGYEPSDDDVVRARLRTMGVQEHRFTFERGADSGREWRVYDVGGARSQVDLLRRKIADGAIISRHITSFGDRPNDVETVCKYLKQKFKEIQKQYSPVLRPYYVYFTSVTDTKATGATLGIVREGILRANLQKADFL